MSIESNALASAALSSARDELRYKYPTKTGLAFSWGRASAADWIDRTVETQSALNEIRYLTMDYAHRHGYFK